MLNTLLYAALGKVFGTVRTTNENSPGTYSYSPQKFSCFSVKGKRKFARVGDWGETFAVCCPVCGDKRFRLYFSHLHQAAVLPEKKKTPIYIGTACYCQNEHCHATPNLRPYLTKLQLLLDQHPTVVFSNEKKKEALEPYSFEIVEAKLPKGCLPLISENLPGFVRDFLESRRWDSAVLDSYGVMYAPAGVEWEGNVFYDNRLVIPIVQRGILASWQARMIGDAPDAKKKYLFPKGCKKGSYLYNFDEALQHADVVLVEGVTDVWRIGTQAMAIFGKAITGTQIAILRKLWGHDGRCLIALDPDAKQDARDMAATLRAAKVFPRGVGVLELEGDPDDYKEEDIQELVQYGFESCKT